MINNDAQQTFTQLINGVDQCNLPLPDFHTSIPLPVFPEHSLPLPPYTEASRVKDVNYVLWLSEIARIGDLGNILNSHKVSDLARILVLLEKSHDQLHTELIAASRTVEGLLDGKYLHLAICHEALATLIYSVKVTIQRFRIQRMNAGLPAEG